MLERLDLVVQVPVETQPVERLWRAPSAACETTTAAKWALSARAVHRTLRLARTLADLSASETIATEAVAEALSYRHETLRLS